VRSLPLPAPLPRRRRVGADGQVHHLSGLRPNVQVEVALRGRNYDSFLRQRACCKVCVCAGVGTLDARVPGRVRPGRYHAGLRKIAAAARSVVSSTEPTKEGYSPSRAEQQVVEPSAASRTPRDLLGITLAGLLAIEEHKGA
jgi:hypothetical protein